MKESSLYSRPFFLLIPIKGEPLTLHPSPACPVRRVLHLDPLLREFVAYPVRLRPLLSGAGRLALTAFHGFTTGFRIPSSPVTGMKSTRHPSISRLPASPR